jgi:tRNA (guanine37-N1)-methyltransferase
MENSSPLRIDVLSLFPRAIDGFLGESILGRARRRRLVEVFSHNIRDWAVGEHFQTDDRPFGGGGGMVLMAEPIRRAIGALRRGDTRVVYLCPDGVQLTTQWARKLAGEHRLILLCGHYEGVDERVREREVDWEISIGDYVLTNGVLAAAVLVDALVRHIPKSLGSPQSLEQDSFNGNLLSFPQYTHPPEFDGLRVPEVLLSGNHKLIDEWRRKQQMERTRLRRPDLWERFENEKEI